MNLKLLLRTCEKSVICINDPIKWLLLNEKGRPKGRPLACQWETGRLPQD